MGNKYRKLGRRQHTKGTKLNAKSKQSSLKVKNKTNNKLIKQKLVKAKSKFISPYMETQMKQRQQLLVKGKRNDISNSGEFDVNDIMDMMDNKELKRIKKTGSNNSNKRPNWALDDNEDDKGLRNYERVPRNTFKKAKIDQSEQNSGDQQNNGKVNSNDDNGVNNDRIDVADDELNSKSLIQLYAERNRKLDDLKTRVALISTSIISHPEININKLRELLSMFDIKSDDKEYGLIFLSIQKIVAFAALEVFRDIIPNYRVKEKINEEDDQTIASKRKNFKLKKETKRLREYEKSLIQLYRLYLLRLERMVECVSKGKKSKKSSFYDDMLTSKKAKQRVAIIGAKCYADLLTTHPHFNFRAQIIEILVPLMANNRYKEISDICFEAITKIYKSDKLGEVSLEAVKCTAKLVKERNYKIDPKVLNTFLCLKINEIKLKEGTSKKDMHKIRNKLDMMSRKERKRNKRMQKLENQLLETEASESRERKLNFHTEILNQVFGTYFRLLKKKVDVSDNENDRKWFHAILSPVLEGLSKFAHLINIEFFDDLITVLYSLLRDNQLDDRQSLHSLQTIFTILSGEGNALNIDFQRFYSHLYCILLNNTVNTTEDDIRALINCVNSMIIKRKKDMTKNRVLAFIKRLSIISLQTMPNASIAALSLLRQIFLDHKFSDILLDSEGVSIGSGIFLPEVEDPEHCNAISTLLFETLFHTRHYDSRVKQFASSIVTGFKGTDVSFLIKKHTLPLFDELSAANDFEYFEKASPITLKKKSNYHYNVGFSAKCLTRLQ